MHWLLVDMKKTTAVLVLAAADSAAGAAFWYNIKTYGTQRYCEGGL
jgi:hypothetical protein